MPLRRLLAPLALLAACGPQATHPAAGPAHPIAAAYPVKPILTENDYDAARPEYDALPVQAPDRAARRAALEKYLLAQVHRDVAHGHVEDAYEAYKNALTLWDPAELAQHPRDQALRQGAVEIEHAFKKRGAHEPVLVALCVQLTLAPGDKGAHARLDEVTAWLRGGGATESEYGATVDGRGRVIDDLETASRLWPSPFVVDRLAQLYFERHAAGASEPLAGKHRRGNDLRAILAGASHSSTAYDLMRLYLRVSQPAAAVAALAKLKSPGPADEQVIKLVDRYASKQANPGDAINIAMLLAQGHEDGDVAEQVCIDAARRFPQAAEPHLCAGQSPPR